MSEIVEGLAPAERERIAQLRRDGHFFWVDVSVPNTNREELAEALGIPDHVLNVLLRFGRDIPPSQRFHADGQNVVFAFSCYLEPTEAAGGSPYRLHPIDSSVLVCGDYLLTLHQERVSLPNSLETYASEGRSEQYVVYAVLDAMTATAFDALHEVERVMQDLELMSTDLRAARVRISTLRSINARLSDMRRRIAPQRGIFERIGEEIGQVEGLEPDSERYFERIHDQLNRLINGIDATGDALEKLINLRVNETIYWLTVVATIFLPLMFITSFFGMNFGWMVREIDTPLAFVLLGIGAQVLAVALTVFLVIRRGTPVELDENTPRPPGQRSS